MVETGKAIIFSAPSGSGKTTIVRHLLEKFPNLSFSISACSRPIRAGEINGKDYYFLSLEQFKQRIEQKDFIEWEEVYKDNYYGTLKSEIDKIWNQGKHVVFDVDVVGGLNLKKYFGSNALAIYVKAPNLQELEKRLRMRNTESEDKIRQRLEKADREALYADRFDLILDNTDLEVALHNAELTIKNFLS